MAVGSWRFIPDTDRIAQTANKTMTSSRDQLVDGALIPSAPQAIGQMADRWQQRHFCDGAEKSSAACTFVSDTRLLATFRGA